MFVRLQSFPDDTSLSYAYVNVDTAALQIESAICPRFRTCNSTSECMRGRLGDPRELRLLSVNIAIEKCDILGEYQTRERSGASRDAVI